MGDGLRKLGSSVIGFAMGVALSALGICIWLEVPAFWFRNTPSFHRNEKIADVFCCLLFGVVLIWWSVLGEIFKYRLFSRWRNRAPWKVPRQWAIGNPTITMVVGIVTAIVAIFTLVHDINKPETDLRPQTIITNQFDSPSSQEPAPTHATSRGVSPKKGSGNAANRAK